MNKVGITLLALMVLMPITLAQETNETETEVMHTPVGALLRFVQLERQIELKLIHGNNIIATINELSIGNTSVLTDILNELVTVQSRVNEYTVPSDEVNLTGLAEVFVDLKTDTVELVNDFRNETHALLEGYNMSEFHERMSVINENSTRVNELSNKVRNYIREYNAYRMNKTLKGLGINNDSLIEQARLGLGKQELNNGLINAYKNHASKSKQAILDLKEELARERIRNRELINNITSGYIARQQERLNNNFANLSRLKIKIQAKIGGSNR